MRLHWPFRRAAATTRDRRIEDRLMSGEECTLRLAPELAVRVSLDGVKMVVTSEHDMPDDEVRQLLMAARFASTFPPAAPDCGHHHDGPVRTIPVRLTPRQNAHVGDVLAAYLRLNSED